MQRKFQSIITPNSICKKKENQNISLINWPVIAIVPTIASSCGSHRHSQKFLEFQRFRLKNILTQSDFESVSDILECSKSVEIRGSFRSSSCREGFRSFISEEKWTFPAKLRNYKDTHMNAALRKLLRLFLNKRLNNRE